MITIILGPPRAGKTALMVKMLNDVAFDKTRNGAMQRIIMDKNENEGFHLTVPTHCAAANFEITFRKQGFKPRQARVIDPNRLGFYPGEKAKIKPHFMLPYETYGIMEAQGYYNSRNFANFPAWQSNLFEQHGHNHLNFILDTQRPGLIDVNIRDLSNFIEIRDLNVNYDKNAFLSNIVWTVREFDNAGLVDEYMKSGKRDKALYKERRIITERNIFSQYNSWSLESKFYTGHEKEDFDLHYSTQYLNDIKQIA